MCYARACGAPRSSNPRGLLVSCAAGSNGSGKMQITPTVDREEEVEVPRSGYRHHRLDKSLAYGYNPFESGDKSRTPLWSYNNSGIPLTTSWH
jgi:hypothetical protein